MIPIIGSYVHATSYSRAAEQIVDWSRQRQSRCVCAANVHTLMEAYESIVLRKAISQADLVTPDGVPLVWIMRAKGLRKQDRVYGPTLMLYVLECVARENIPVGFYGSTPEVLEALRQRMQAKYEDLQVSFVHSPPFCNMSPAEDEAIIQKINCSGVRILFVGLGCPKQEIWMANHRGKVNAVMLGVGAAFDFHAGLKPQAPAWMQRLGLEWLFRLGVEPRRLWKRYLYHNPRFVVLAIADLLGLLKKPT